MPFPDSEYPSIMRGRDKRESQRLMAAAPEMLDALKEALEVMGEWGADGDPQWALAARAAIDKAEGRE